MRLLSEPPLCVEKKDANRLAKSQGARILRKELLLGASTMGNKRWREGGRLAPGALPNTSVLAEASEDLLGRPSFIFRSISRRKATDSVH